MITIKTFWGIYASLNPLGRGEKNSYEYLINCVCDLDVVVGLFYILAINMGVFVQKIFAKILVGTYLKKKKQQRKIIVGISIPSRNMRTIPLYRDSSNRDCRDAVLLIEVHKVNCRPKGFCTYQFWNTVYMGPFLITTWPNSDTEHLSAHCRYHMWSYPLQIWFCINRK